MSILTSNIREMDENSLEELRKAINNSTNINSKMIPYDTNNKILEDIDEIPKEYITNLETEINKEQDARLNLEKEIRKLRGALKYLCNTKK